MLCFLSLPLDAQIIFLCMRTNLCSGSCADMARDCLDILLTEKSQALEKTGVLIWCPVARSGLFLLVRLGGCGSGVVGRGTLGGGLVRGGRSGNGK